MKNYFRYLPPASHEDVWGGSVTGIGHTRMVAKSPYPPARHPDDHHFVWERGRVLNAYQFIFISEGAGVLESGRPGQAFPIRGGQAFVLFPGIWHRYAPDPATGWVEHWLECKGRVYDAAWQRELLTPARPVIEPGAAAPLLEALLRCHDWAQRDVEGAPELLASLGVHVLGLLVHGAGQVPGPRRALEQKLEKARRLLVERCDRPLDLASLAEELGLGYSLLRQSFGRHSGQSARRFHTEARLRRACDLLANSTLSVKEIGDLLGYSSAFHFSAGFKSGRGCSPSEWRRRQIPDPAG